MSKKLVTKKAHCVDGLRRWILMQDLEAGSYLEEVERAEAYGMSRPPLREALNQLASEGYVVLHKNRGA